MSSLYFIRIYSTLSFSGNNTFFFIWLESLAFFSANIGILAKIIRKHREKMEHIENVCNIQKLDWNYF